MDFKMLSAILWIPVLSTSIILKEKRCTYRLNKNHVDGRLSTNLSNY